MNRETRHIVILATLWAAVHVLLFGHYGIRTFDDSIIYTDAATFLAAHGYLADPDQLFYSIPIACIALFGQLTMTPAVWFVCFQCVVSGAAVISLYRAAATLFGDSRSGLMAGCLYMLWWEMIHWNTTVMTESLASSVICFLLYCLVHFAERRRNYLAIALWTLVSVLIRPTGLIVALIVCLFFIEQFRKQRVIHKIWFAVLCVFIVVVFLAGAQYLFTRWDFTDQYKRGNIITYADVLAGSAFDYPLMRLDEPLRMPDGDAQGLFRMALFVVHNPLYFIKAMFLKIGYLLSGMRPYYTLLHNVYSGMWNMLIYLLFVKGCGVVNRKYMVTVVVRLVMLNCLLVGVSSVDWDNRFFVPMVPGLVLMAGGGLSSFVRRLRGAIALR